MSRSVRAANKDQFQAIYPRRSQKVSVGAVAASSGEMDAHIVELFATTDCWVVFGEGPGDSPVAVANDGSSFFLGGGLFKYYGLQPGVVLSVIRDSASGDLHIIEGG